MSAPDSIAAATEGDTAEGTEETTLNDADAPPTQSSTPFTTAAALHLVDKRIHSLQVLERFHKHLCWFQSVQMTQKDVDGSFPNDASRRAFVTDCVYLGLGIGKIMRKGPTGIDLLNACRQLVREFAFHRSSSPIRAALLLAARSVPYQYLPERETRQYDARSIALHKHKGTGDVVYKFLECPQLPFCPDHLLAIRSTCQSLLQMYGEIRTVVVTKTEFGITERDKVCVVWHIRVPCLTAHFLTKI